MFYRLGIIEGTVMYAVSYDSREKDRGYYVFRGSSPAEGPFPEKYMRQTIIMDAHGDPKIYLPILEQMDGLKDTKSLTMRAAQLAEADNDMRWALIQARKRAGLSQQDVADLMDVPLSTIVAFQREDSDPRLSMIRRYALAVGATVEHQVTSCKGEQYTSVNGTNRS